MRLFSRKSLLLTCSLFAVAPAMAQGVPSLDQNLILKALDKLKSDNEDLEIQDKKRATTKEAISTDDEIIAELDKLIEAGTLPQASTEATIEELEQGSGDPKASADNLYNPEDKNPAGAKAFGDASQTVEQLIIRGAKETYGLSGVQKAGLSQAQWRALLQAMIWAEFSFNPYIGSHAGAWGLTQLMPDTAKELGVSPAYRTDPYAQVKGGATYLARMLNMFNGDIKLGLAAYNAGAGNVKKYGGVPPFKETREYVVKIPNKYNQYLAKIGGVDAEGTIEPSLAAGANYALASGAAAEYGDHSAAQIAQIAKRLKDIIIQMRSNDNPTKAWALNTYARAEMVRIMALRTRMAAVQVNQVSAEALQEAVDHAEERKFFTFTGSSL